MKRNHRKDLGKVKVKLSARGSEGPKATFARVKFLLTLVLKGEAPLIVAFLSFLFPLLEALRANNRITRRMDESGGFGLRLKEEDHHGDTGRRLWIPSSLSQQLLIGEGSWVKVKMRNKTEKGKGPWYWCQAAVEEDSSDSGSVAVALTPTGLLNLLRSSGLTVCDYYTFSQIAVDIVPAYVPGRDGTLVQGGRGREVKICRLKGMKGEEGFIVDAMLQDFFADERLLGVGDVIRVPFCGGKWEEFCIKEVDKEKTFGEKTFSVSSKWSALSLIGEEINGFHVPAAGKDSLPAYLGVISSSLVKLFSYAASVSGIHSVGLWPVTLIHGETGTGKYSIVVSVAEQLGLNFCSVNAINFVGDTSAFCEAKLIALAERLKGIVPCLVYIRNIHMLGRDKEGNEDRRAISAFQEFISDVLHATKSDNLPVFIIASSNDIRAIPGGLRDCFVDVRETLKFVEKKAIADVMRWFAKKYEAVLRDVDVDNWVEKACYGVNRSWADFNAVFSFGLRSFYQELRQQTDDEHSFSIRKTINIADINEIHLNFGLDSVDKVLKGENEGPKIPNVTWDDIGGLSTIKSELINSVQLPLLYPNLFSSGIKRSGILLWGPPGTGKTLIAKAVATEFKLNFLSVKGPELLNMYVGQSEQNVREVFDKAKQSAPSILFFDELDSLAPNRGKSGDSGGVMDRVVSQILAELDGSHSSPGVFIIGATNRPDLIDPALLRPGRFDKLLYVGVDERNESKTKILQALTRKFSLGSTVDLEEIARRLPSGMTGADIYSVCAEAYMSAIANRIRQEELQEISELEVCRLDCITKERTDEEEGSVSVEQSDFLHAVDRAVPSLSLTELQGYERLKTSLE